MTYFILKDSYTCTTQKGTTLEPLGNKDPTNHRFWDCPVFGLGTRMSDPYVHMVPLLAVLGVFSVVTIMASSATNYGSLEEI